MIDFWWHLVIYKLIFLCSIHKQIPVVATSSGQRHVSEVDDEEDGEMLVKKTGKDEIENMIKLWWCGPIKNSETV